MDGARAFISRVMADDCTLSRLLSLALGAPEIKSQNFTILHRLLQFVLARLNLADVRVKFEDLGLSELIGTDAVTIDITSVDSSTASTRSNKGIVLIMSIGLFHVFCSTIET